MAPSDEAVPAKQEQPQTAKTGPVTPTIVSPSSDADENSSELAALRALRERYEALVLATGQITWIARGDSAAIDPEDGRDWRLFTGQSSEASHAGGWLEAIHLDDRARVKAAWAAAMAARTAYEVEYRVRRYDGEYRWLLIRGVPTFESDGSVREWVGTATDITERSLADAALRASEAQLADELADMRRLQLISGQLIREGDLDALYAQLVEAAIVMMRADMGSIQMLDVERNELRLLAWKGFHPASAEFWQRVRVDSRTTCGAALDTGQRYIEPDVSTSEFMVGTQDLEYYLLSGIMAVQSTPLISRSGALVGMISTHWRTPHEPDERNLRMLDVLARQAADLIERAQVEDALRVSGRRKDEFLGIAGHELRTPLTSLAANVQLARRTLRPPNASAAKDLSATVAGTSAEHDDEQGAHAPSGRRLSAAGLTRLQHQLESMDRQVGRLARLVSDLLDAARIQSGMLELRLEVCDLIGIVTEAVEAQRATWPSRQISLDTAGQLRLILIADADRVGQVVTNYLVNALKYSAADQPVELRASLSPGAVRVEVSDHGPGLAPEELKRVFDHYYRASGVEQQRDVGGGLGLGLHISKTIVERHGGAVGVQSALGAGSVFWFTLPQSDADTP